MFMRGKPTAGQMSQEELRELIGEAVHDGMTRAGIDASDPIEVQKDMAHLRAQRLTSEKVKGKVYVTLIGALVTGTLATLWLGFKSSIGQS